MEKMVLKWGCYYTACAILDTMLQTDVADRDTFTDRIAEIRTKPISARKAVPQEIDQIQKDYSAWQDEQYFNQLWNGDVEQSSGAFLAFHSLALVAPIIGVSSTIVAVKLFEQYNKKEETIEQSIKN